jgi:hypothetical protein
MENTKEGEGFPKGPLSREKKGLLIHSRDCFVEKGYIHDVVWRSERECHG